MVEFGVVTKISLFISICYIGLSAGQLQGPGVMKTNPLLPGRQFGMPKKDIGADMKGLYALLAGENFLPGSGQQNKLGTGNQLPSIPISADPQLLSIPAVGQTISQQPSSETIQLQPGIGLPMQQKVALGPLQNQPGEEQVLQQQPTVGQPNQQQPPVGLPMQQEAGEEQPVHQQSASGQPMQQQPAAGQPVQQEAGEEQAMPRPAMGQTMKQQPIVGQPMQPLPTFGRSARPSAFPMGQLPGMSLLVPQLSLETQIEQMLLSQLLSSQNPQPSGTQRGRALGQGKMAAPSKVTQQSMLLRYNPTMDPKMAAELVQLLKTMVALQII